MNLQDNEDTKILSSSVIADRFEDNYFLNRLSNDPLRMKQFAIDSKFIKRYVRSGNLCDVGCSTGEFVNFMDWDGECFGMEVNENAKKIAVNYLSFDKNIFTEQNFFDVIIFRGVIQHVDNPFEMIKASYKALKSGGYVFFLATPNTDSVLYRLKLDLPFLDPSLNFYIPGARQLSNALENFGFEMVKIDYPYWRSPYRRFFKDHFLFLLNLISRRFYRHAFWGSSMSLAAIKPVDH